MQNGFVTIKKSLSLLSREERKKLNFIGFIIAVLSFVELFGVVSIFPFMSVAANPSSIESNKYLAWGYEYFHFSDTHSFLLFLGVLVLIVLFLGNFIRASSSYILLRFAHMQNYNLSRRVFSIYLSRPYEYFLRQNSSDLSKTVLHDVHQIINGLYIPLFRAYGRSCSVLCIVAFLIFMDPILALTVTLVLGLSYVSIYLFFKKKLAIRGEERTSENKKRFRVVSEAAGGIKEIKLMHLEKTYLEEYEKPSLKFSQSEVYHAIVVEVPRYILETVAFSGILTIIIYFIFKKESHGEAIAVTSIYAVAGYKMIPALQEIFASIANIKYTLPMIGAIHTIVDQPFQIKDTPSNQDIFELKSEITISNLSFRYQQTTKDAIKNINLVIKPKTTIGIVGQTGSGKTTLIDIILGLLSPSEGKLLVDGIELLPNNIRSWQKIIGYVPQFIYLSDNTISCNIAFGVKPEDIDHEQVIRAAKMAQIHDFIMKDMPLGYDTEIGERGSRLSGGQRQRIGIARALYYNPKLLVMDEATSALDNKTEEDFMKSIENLSGQITIIMIAHRLSTLSSCDRVVNLENGHLASEHI